MTQIPDDQSPEHPVVPEPKTLGTLARFAGPDELVAAARDMRGKGYTKLEAYSPFPVLGIDEALAAPKPILPWVVLGAGLTGMCVALVLQYYTNSVEGPWAFSGYDYHISGKPSFSLPANIPVTFELIILFSAFTAFLGMLAFNGLPRFYNPIFRSQQFLDATDDGFFLFADARDSLYSASAASEAFAAIGGTNMETITDDPTPAKIPGWFHVVGGSLIVVAMLPVAYIAMARNETSASPRWQLWIDMDFQPKVKTQRLMPSNIFVDRRSMRLPVEGTVARGTLYEDPRVFYGVEPDSDIEEVLFLQEEAAGTDEAGSESADDDAAEEDAAADSADGDDSAADESTEDGSEDPAAADPEQPEPNWVKTFPMEVTQKMVERGRERYNIHCAPCHGLGGYGDGLVAQRALALEQPTWVQPSNIHQDYIRAQAPGKLYNTVSNGIRKMPGYREHIALEDRWAIVLYIKALQKSQYADAELLNEAQRSQLPTQ
jgi:mono/diheme cytochrome c family protein